MTMMRTYHFYVRHFTFSWMKMGDSVSPEYYNFMNFYIVLRTRQPIDLRTNPWARRLWSAIGTDQI